MIATIFHSNIIPDGVNMSDQFHGAISHRIVTHINIVPPSDSSYVIRQYLFFAIQMFLQYTMINDRVELAVNETT